MMHSMERRNLSYGIGLIIILIFWLVLGSSLTASLIPVLQMWFPDLSLREPGREPVGYFLLAQAGFVMLAAGILLAASRIPDLGIRGLFTDKRHIRFRLFTGSILLWLVLLGVISAFGMLIFPQETELTFSAPEFFTFLPLVLIFTPVQAGSEELLFRSYLRRWASGIPGVRNPGVLIPLSGALFLAAHLQNPEIQAFGGAVFIYGYYFLFGCLLMALTIHDRGVEAAAGIHTANNLFSLLILSYEGAVLPSPAVFTTGSLNPAASLAALVIAAPAYLKLREYLRLSN